jgi:hypothetical protein
MTLLGLYVCFLTKRTNQSGLATADNFKILMDKSSGSGPPVAAYNPHIHSPLLSAAYERKVDRIIYRHLSSRTGLAVWLFEKAFANCKLITVDSSELGKPRNHRNASENPMAYGQTDVEVVATTSMPNGKTKRVGLLIENKVDARQGENQGLRYRARAEFRQEKRCWEEFRCVLVAPQHYLDNAYPTGGFLDEGWDKLIALDDIAQILKKDCASLEQIKILVEATKLTNTWNKPIPSAVQYWKELTDYQRAFHPNVPIFA